MTSRNNPTTTPLKWKLPCGEGARRDTGTQKEDRGFRLELSKRKHLQPRAAIQQVTVYLSDIRLNTVCSLYAMIARILISIHLEIYVQ